MRRYQLHQFLSPGREEERGEERRGGGRGGEGRGGEGGEGVREGRGGTGVKLSTCTEMGYPVYQGRDTFALE